MDENPYQPPRSDAQLTDQDVPLTARFSCSSDLLRRACRKYVAEPSVAAPVVMVFVVGLIGIMISFLAVGVHDQLASAGVLAWTVLWGYGGPLFLVRRTLQRVYAHPLLAADQWREVHITANSLTVMSAEQSATWPLERVIMRGSHREFLILELDPFLILVIPGDAEVDPQPFETFRDLVRRRLRRYGLFNLSLR